MSLFITTTEQVTGRGYHLFGGIGDRLLNTEGIFQLMDNDTVKSSFYYRMNLEDGQEGIARIESDDSSSVLAAYWGSEITSPFVELSVYPDANPSGVTTTQSFNTSKIILAYAFDSGSIVYLKEGGQTKRYLVSETIVEIIVEVMEVEDDSDYTLLFDDGISYFRLQVRNGALNLDQTITDYGFYGAEDSDWGNIWEKSLS